MRTVLLALGMLFVGIGVGWIIKPVAPVVAEIVPAESAGESLLISVSSSDEGNSVDGPQSVTRLLDMVVPAGGMGAQATLYAQVSKLSLEEIKRCLQDLQEQHSRDRRTSNANQVLFSRWAELDPESLFHFASEANGGWTHQAKLLSITRLAEKDFSRAGELVASLVDRGMRRRAIGALVAAAEGKFNNERVLEFLQEHSAESSGSYQLLFHQWAENDPAAAAVRLGSISGFEERGHALRGLGEVWATKDPQAAMQWALSLRSPLERTEMLGTIASSASGGKIAVGAEFLEATKVTGQARNHMIRSLIDSTIGSDPENTLRWIDSLPAQERRWAFGNAFDDVVRQDPRRAKELMAENFSQCSAYADQIATGLAREDAAEAQRWVATLPEGDVQANARKGVLEVLVETDPAAAVRFMEEDGGLTAERLEGSNGLIYHWLGKDREGLQSWINGQKDVKVRGILGDVLVELLGEHDPKEAGAYALTMEGDARESALRSVVENWAKSDPEAVGQFVAQLPAADQPVAKKQHVDALVGIDLEGARVLFEDYLPTVSDDVDFAGTAGRIASTWSRLDAPAAAEWAVALEDEEMQRRSVGEAARGWIGSDLMRASEWIGDLPGGEARDGAVWLLVSQIEKSDPSAAFTWAITMSDLETRQRTLGSVIDDWRERDSEAAFHALQAADLDADTYENLAERFQ